jgi:hypothetical protein
MLWAVGRQHDGRAEHTPKSAPWVALWRADAPRAPLPSVGDAEWQMPNARGPEPWSGHTFRQTATE